MESSSVQRPSITPATAIGFAWLFGQTIVLKLVSISGRIVLARWLAPADFGLVGLADTVVVVALLIQRYGIHEQLVRLRARMEAYVSAAFWLSVVTGLVGSALILLVSPWAVAFYGEPRLARFFLLLGATSALMTIHLVPLARLEAELRYRYIAIVNTISGVSSTVLAVGFAFSGLGALSLVLPRPIAAAASAGALFVAVRPRIRWALQTSLWPYLLGGGGLLLMVSLATLVVSYGDYAIIGRRLGTEAVGLYYFAFGMATQTSLLLTDNLARVLLPVFSALIDEPVERRREGFLRSVRVLALVGMPLCFVQAATAAPLIRLLFGARWLGAAPILEVLSLGMVGSLLAHPSRALLKAYGRLGTLLGLALGGAALFLALVAWAATTGSLFQVTAVVSLCFVVIGVAHLAVTLRVLDAGWSAFRQVCVPPLVAGGMAVTAAWMITAALPMSPTTDVLRLLVTVSAGAAFYALALRFIYPIAWRDLGSEIKNVYSGLRKHGHQLRS